MAAASKNRGITALDGTTKARIERAALSLFASHDMNSVTTKAIAASAGVSEGSLYTYFHSKEDIWAELFSTIHERLSLLVEAAGKCDPHIEGQIAALVRAYCQTADEDWALFTFHLLTMHRFLPKARKRPTGPVLHAEKMIEAAMAKRQIAQGDAPFLTAICLGVVLQAALHKIYGRVSGPMMAREADLTRAILAILNPVR